MRVATGLTAIGLAALLGVAGCGASKNETMVAPAPEVAAPETPTDPYAWTDVDYQEYRSAALQVPLSPELLIGPTDLTASLDALCHTDPAGFAALLAEHRTKAGERPNSDLAKHLGEEVSLRLGMACPQRMGDWMTARGDAERADDPSAGTDVASSRPTDGDQPSVVEGGPQEVEGEQLPQDPYVDTEDEMPDSVAGGGGG